MEGYRKICFDVIPRFPNPIPQEVSKIFPKFAGNNANLSTSFLSSSSHKIDPNQFVADASTSNIMNNNTNNVANNPRMNLQRRPIHLEGYRQIYFDGILGFPNPIPQEMGKRLP